MKNNKDYSYIMIVLVIAVPGLIVMGFGVAKDSENMAMSGFIPLTMASMYYFRIVKRIGTILPEAR